MKQLCRTLTLLTLTGVLAFSALIAAPANAAVTSTVTLPLISGLTTPAPFSVISVLRITATTPDNPIAASAISIRGDITVVCV